MDKQSIGESNNTPMSNPGVVTKDDPATEATTKVDGEKPETTVTGEAGNESSILDYIKDFHSKLGAILNKAKVNGSPEPGEKLFDVNNVLEHLESIQNPSERTAFYKANRALVGKALIARRVS